MTKEGQAVIDLVVNQVSGVESNEGLLDFLREILPEALSAAWEQGFQASQMGQRTPNPFYRAADQKKSKAKVYKDIQGVEIKKDSEAV